MLWKASRRDVCIFRTLVARWMAHRSSLVVACITTATSPRSPVAAAALQRRFIAASELGRSADRCTPTKMIGTGVFTMNLIAAAEHAIVSVP